MTKIFIFNNASNAAGYGIGTYVKQLSEGISSAPETIVSLVEMHADTKEFYVHVDDLGMCHFLIPQMGSGIESEAYCRCIFYFLARNIEVDCSDKLVFQFNYFQHYPLALLLKGWKPNSIIIFTVHYMNWCFELKGNVHRMREITSEGYVPIDDMEKRVIYSFNNERTFLHFADIVFVLSQSSKDILASDYFVSQNKTHLVYNGIGNEVFKKLQRRNRDARNILYVGRLDNDKGLSYLISAFIRIADKYPNTNLIIVGDGDFRPYIEQSRNISGRVIFLGKIDKDEIEKHYLSAYMGVIPSFHEQCSYTVIEMMRYGLPIIGTDAIGLGEMLEKTPNLQVHIKEGEIDERDFVSQIVSRLNMLLSDHAAYRLASEAVLKQYKEKYTLSAMTQKVLHAIQTILLNGDSFIAPDYLQHIDSHMIDLINKRPEISIDFYGKGGIGVYLWWRILQMKKAASTDAEQIALLQEHLIYYLDWVCESVYQEQIPVELIKTLHSMKEHSFYPMKVDQILELDRTTRTDSGGMPSEKSILMNALKICTCKI